jgi:nicotinamidase-related amidase
MAKDRIEDTFKYLTDRAEAGDLANVRRNDVADFRQLFDKNDLTNGGAVLSLDWSWYNSRPSESVRHAIRAYLLVSLYTYDVLPSGINAQAILVKQKTALWLHQQISERLEQLLGLRDPANIASVLYELKARGHDTHRAQPVCSRLGFPLEASMDLLHKSSKTAIVLIDMQSASDVGQRRYCGDRTVLEHQVSVLKKAAKLKWIIYDIVIDVADASAWGNPFALKDFTPEQKLNIVREQRKPEYAQGAHTKTIGMLRDLYRGAQVRHIPKPTHPSFYGTLFSEHLEADGVKTVIVMGYDANQCVKATVFGVPSETREEAQREPTAKEVELVMSADKTLTVQQAQKRATPMKTVVTDYIPGLLDRNIAVVTARCVLASGYAPLDAEWSVLSSRR